MLLIVVGILGFVFNSVTVTTSEEVADVGPVEIEKQESKTIPVGPIASGVTLVTGVVFIGFAMRDRGAS